MSGVVLSYIGALSVLAWGVTHLFPVRGVIAGFGDISTDNRRILAMEWITEGVALISIGVLVGVVNWLDRGSAAAMAVSWVTSATLVALAGVSLFTGFRVAFLPYRLCPIIFSASAALILAGAYVG